MNNKLVIKIAKIAAVILACAAALAAFIIFAVKTIGFIMLHPYISGFVAFIPLVYLVISLRLQSPISFKNLSKDPMLILNHWKWLVKFPIIVILSIIAIRGLILGIQLGVAFVQQNLGWFIIGGIFVFGLVMLALRFKPATVDSELDPDWDILQYNLGLIRNILHIALQTLPTSLYLNNAITTDMIKSSEPPAYMPESGWAFTYDIPKANHEIELNCDAIKQFTSGRLREILLSRTPCGLPQNTVIIGGLPQPILNLIDVHNSTDKTHAVFVIQYHNSLIHNNTHNVSSNVRGKMYDDKL